MMPSFSVLSLIVCLLLLSQHTTAITCPPLNPPLPLHGPLAGRPAISNAARSLQDSIETTLQEGVSLDKLTTSFSVEFYSLEDKAPLFRYHFSAPGLANASIGVSEVDSDTIYRLGSISKVFTVYTFLARVGDASWNQPITKYVPELAQAAKRTKDDSVLDKVRWGDVTVGSLASHLSGISRSTAPNGQADFLLRLLAGFPAVPAVGGEYCNGTADAQFPCDRASFFTNLLAQHPVVPAQSTPMYSNIAFQILAYTLENMTRNNARFPDLMKNTILAPLHLASTYYPLASRSSVSNAIIPFNDSLAGYFVDFRSYNPGGAVYSTANDMRAFGKSILGHTLLSPALTRRWLKPHAFTPDTYITFGAPWEIVPFPARSRFPVQIYSKSGQIGLYSTMMGLMPDYNVGFTVLVAGPRFGTASVLSDLVVSKFVPAIKQVAANQAGETYAGTYVSSNGKSNASFSVLANEGDFGSTLRLDGLVYNGMDLLALLALAQGLDGATAELVVDVYSTGVRESAGGQTRESWRASFGVQAIGGGGIVPELGPFSATCGGGFDLQKYGGVAIDELVFRRERGEVTGLEVRFLQQGVWGKDGEGGNVRREEGVVADAGRLKMMKV